MVVTGVASAAILIIGLGYGPETSIKVFVVMMHDGQPQVPFGSSVICVMTFPMPIVPAMKTSCEWDPVAT